MQIILMSPRFNLSSKEGDTETWSNEFGKCVEQTAKTLTPGFVVKIRQYRDAVLVVVWTGNLHNTLTNKQWVMLTEVISYVQESLGMRKSKSIGVDYVLLRDSMTTLSDIVRDGWCINPRFFRHANISYRLYTAPITSLFIYFQDERGMHPEPMNSKQKSVMSGLETATDNVIAFWSEDFTPNRDGRTVYAGITYARKHVAADPSGPAAAAVAKAVSRFFGFFETGATRPIVDICFHDGNTATCTSAQRYNTPIEDKDSLVMFGRRVAEAASAFMIAGSIQFIQTDLATASTTQLSVGAAGMVRRAIDWATS